MQSPLQRTATVRFRSEALVSHQDRWLGGVRLAQPWSFALIAVLSLSASASLVGFVAWGELTRKTRVVGVLAPSQGALPIIASATGVVVAIASDEQLPAGASLFVIDTDRVGTTQIAGVNVVTGGGGGQRSRRARRHGPN